MILLRNAVVACAALVAALVMLSGVARASQGYRWFVIPLMPELVDKYIRCAPGLYRAGERINAKISGTAKSDARKRHALLEAKEPQLLKTCGFPRSVPYSFRSVGFSTDLAYGLHVRHPSGTRDKRGNEVEDETEAARIRAHNVIVVVPFKPRLLRFYTREKMIVPGTPATEEERNTEDAETQKEDKN